MKEKRYPIGWHPANEEEAVARIEAIEAEYEKMCIRDRYRSGVQRCHP